MNQVTIEGGRSSSGYMNLAYLQAGSLNHLPQETGVGTRAGKEIQWRTCMHPPRLTGVGTGGVKGRAREGNLSEATFWCLN